MVRVVNHIGSFYTFRLSISRLPRFMVLVAYRIPYTPNMLNRPSIAATMVITGTMRAMMIILLDSSSF